MANSFGKGQGELQILPVPVTVDPPVWSIEADRAGWRSKVLLNGELFPGVSEVTLRISAKGTTELTLVLLPHVVKVTPIDGTIYFEVGDRRFRVEKLVSE